MHEAYRDIRDRIKEEPKWWDENGVPRYDDFHPRFCPDIYAPEVILLHIQCQDCHEDIMVEMSYSEWGGIISGKKSDPFSKIIRKFKKTGGDFPFHYGDPPNHDCPGAGESMNCIDIAIVQFWQRKTFDWRRKINLEVKNA
jgi:hypothetical protein